MELGQRGLSDGSEISGWCEPRFHIFLTGYTKENVVQAFS